MFIYSACMVNGHHGHILVNREFCMGSTVDDQQVGCLWQGSYLLSVSLSGFINYLDVNDPKKPLRVVKVRLETCALTLCRAHCVWSFRGTTRISRLLRHRVMAPPSTLVGWLDELISSFKPFGVIVLECDKMQTHLGPVKKVVPG